MSRRTAAFHAKGRLLADHNDRGHALCVDIDHVDGFRSLLLTEDLGQTTKVVTHSGISSVVPGLHRLSGRVPDDLEVEVGQERLDSALIPGTGGPPCKLDVLLRHRPASISPGTTPFHANRCFSSKAAVSAYSRGPANSTSSTGRPAFFHAAKPPAISAAPWRKVAFERMACWQR